MRNEQRLDNALARLRSSADPALPDGFMDGVWMRAGQMEALSAQRTRFVLFAAMAFIGLGAGFGTTQAPAHAEPAGYQLVEGANLSPAALLHVEP
ncbi:hypothetical protein [Sphingopyxis granuli]|uniref:Uncharacterized protein n=1 Tax=Sphingopyxis granuli TaxID=267128 RepID=A0AA86L3H9_9SPHN|nr:hypothetical protein [Sphingopyxis granuli]AMG75159.1 Uncharacterized protein SGRAN_2810 [Sphingopyxis granuli]